MKKGQEVELVQPVVSGIIVQTRYHESAEELEHLVKYNDADGNEQHRWFIESQLKAVPKAADDAPADAPSADAPTT